jgi:hypothetical protein
VTVTVLENKTVKVLSDNENVKFVYMELDNTALAK